MKIPKEEQPADDYNIYARKMDGLGYLKSCDANREFLATGSAGFRDDTAKARIQAVSCYQGQAVGLVIRGNCDEKYSLLPPNSNRYEEPETKYAPRKKITRDFLNSVYEVCDPLYRLLFPEDRARKGLLVISGATNSMKSKIANGLIHLYLSKRMSDWVERKVLRKPHIVTFEDPIESLLVEWDCIVKSRFFDQVYKSGVEGGWKGSGDWFNSRFYPDYTPREKGIDVTNLEAAISDALRQTPTVFYASETRSPKDWPALFRLAESHLVVTTTHSSSMVAAFNSLHSGLGAHTSTERSEMASVLLGVVHLRPDKDPTTNPPLNYNIPSLWRRTAYGIKAFAAEGMSSLIPTFVDSIETATLSDYYYLGRQTFATLLVDAAKSNSIESRLTGVDPSKRHPQITDGDDVSNRIVDAAVDLDLRGE